TGGNYGLLTFTAGQLGDTISVPGKGATRVVVNGAGGNDNVTVTASGVEVNGGTGDDTFTVSSVTGLATLDGAGGTDRVVLARSASMTLTNQKLTVSATNAFTLTSIERATLTGGAGNQRFTLTGWTGQATINGAAGTDTVAMVGGAFTLTNTQLKSGTAV